MPEKRKSNSKRGLGSLHQGEKREKNSFCPPQKSSWPGALVVFKSDSGARLCGLQALGRRRARGNVGQWQQKGPGPREGTSGRVLGEVGLRSEARVGAVGRVLCSCCFSFTCTKDTEELAPLSCVGHFLLKIYVFWHRIVWRGLEWAVGRSEPLGPFSVESGDLGARPASSANRGGHSPWLPPESPSADT